jgi:hypothetical protein
MLLDPARLVFQSEFIDMSYLVDRIKNSAPAEAKDLIARATGASILNFKMRGSVDVAPSKPTATERPEDQIVQFEDGTAVCLARFLRMYAEA